MQRQWGNVLLLIMVCVLRWELRVAGQRLLQDEGTDALSTAFVGLTPAHTCVESVGAGVEDEEEWQRGIEGLRHRRRLIPRRLPAAKRDCDYSRLFDATFAPSPAPSPQLEQAVAATEEALCIWAEVLAPAPFGSIKLRIDPVAAEMGGARQNGRTPAAQTSTNFQFVLEADDVTVTQYSSAQLRYGIIGDVTAGLASLGVEWDATLDFSQTTNFYYGMDAAAIEEDAFDFVSVVTRELGHALGFSSKFIFGIAANENDDQDGALYERQGPYWVEVQRHGSSATGFNMLMQETSAADSRVVNPQNFPTSRADQRSSSIFTAGTVCIADEEQGCVPIYTPDPFEFGSSMSNFDEDFFPPGNFDSLLTPSLAPSEVMRCVGSVTKRVFQRLGFALSPDCKSTCVNRLTGEHDSCAYGRGATTGEGGGKEEDEDEDETTTTAAAVATPTPAPAASAAATPHPTPASSAEAPSTPPPSEAEAEGADTTSAPLSPLDPPASEETSRDSSRSTTSGAAPSSLFDYAFLLAPLIAGVRLLFLAG